MFPIYSHMKSFKQISGERSKTSYIGCLVFEIFSGTIVCNEPLSCLSFKVSIFKVDPKGKECKTTFTRLSYNGKTSVVKCKLLI